MPLRRFALCAMLPIAVVSLAGSLHASQATQPQLSAAEQAANALLQASDWPKAIEAFTALTRSEPTNARAWFGLNLALHGNGQFDEALAALPKARELGYPNIGQLHFRAARAWARKGDRDKAFTELAAAVSNGWTNLPSAQVADLDSLRDDPRFASVFLEGMNRQLKPCEYDPDFRAFDFWIGEWDVQRTGVPRAPQGSTSRIEKSLDGCLIIENWEPPAPPAGKSFNTWNKDAKRWEQFWVDASGRLTHFIGHFQPDGSLRYESTESGGTTLLRMTFFNQGPDQVRQFGQHSTDGGKTWQVRYDLTYVRKK